MGFLLFFLRAAVIASLAIDRSPHGVPTDCDCPEIPPLDRTLPPPEKCRKLGDHYRYTCIDGYLRKAGTSNLIICVAEGGVARWQKRSVPLQCIPDPKIPPTTQKTKQTVPVPRATSTPLTPTALRDDHSSPWTTTAGSSGGGSSNSTSQNVLSHHNNGNERKGNQINGDKTSTDHSIIAVVIISVSLACALIGLVFHICRRRAAGRNSGAAREDDPDVQMSLAGLN